MGPLQPRRASDQAGCDLSARSRNPVHAAAGGGGLDCKVPVIRVRPVAQVIPDEAVNASKSVAWGRYGSRPDAAYVRSLLEAAAPHMLTRVTNAVINRAFEDGQASALARLADAYDEGLEAGDGLRPRGNPYI